LFIKILCLSTRIIDTSRQYFYFDTITHSQEWFMDSSLNSFNLLDFFMSHKIYFEIWYKIFFDKISCTLTRGCSLFEWFNWKGLWGRKNICILNKIQSLNIFFLSRDKYIQTWLYYHSPSPNEYD
jgi:hypothetical protein